MSSTSIELRKRQSELELAVTDVRNRVAAALTALFLATVLAVPIAEEWLRYREPAGERRPLALTGLPEAAAEAARVAVSDGPIAADLGLLETIDGIEDRLEDESFLRELLLPRVQATLLAATGLGNEEVYPGRDNWLFYRADVDHVTGPGFLEADVLLARRRGGDAWRQPPQPDPRPAILDLARDLETRGIALVVMPTPVKPSVHPGRFAARAGGSAEPVRNRSTGELVGWLRDAGVTVFDPYPILIGTGDDGDARYLRADTHWTPAAMERVAAALATELDRSHELGRPGVVLYERQVTVESGGDLTSMLRLPEGQRLVAPERVTVRTVIDATGASWRPSPGAPVLLLGDSFTNVFADARLGWGAAAGLAERLSFHLRRPVDRIALNAGGAHASREALARELASSPDRLAGTRVVIYQFAERELSSGDWRSVGL